MSDNDSNKTCERSRCGANIRWTHGELDRLHIIWKRRMLGNGTVSVPCEILDGKSKHVEREVHGICKLYSAYQSSAIGQFSMDFPTPRGSLPKSLVSPRHTCAYVQATGRHTV
jgi:hypothetical protein